MFNSIMTKYTAEMHCRNASSNCYVTLVVPQTWRYQSTVFPDIIFPSHFCLIFPRLLVNFLTFPTFDQCQILFSKFTRRLVTVYTELQAACMHQTATWY